MKIPFYFILLILYFSSCEKENFAAKNLIEQQEVIKTKSTSYSLESWMTSLSNDKKITDLSIPGTHDAGAMYESWPGTAACQNLGISEQLNIGVRFLDIRCRHMHNAFEIYHGSVDQKLSFDDVLDDCWAFLQANPGETIIMSVKQEHTAVECNRWFEETFDEYTEKNITGWYLNTHIPTLGEVRGKIILFRRFGNSNSNKGLSAHYWPDNNAFEYDNGNFRMRVQDKYKVISNKDKLASVKYNLWAASTQQNNTLYLNFTSGSKSGTFGIPSITAVSDYINPKLEEYFTEKDRKARFGILIMDFVNEYRSDLIVKTNF